MNTLDDFLKEKNQDPNFKKTYEELALPFQIATIVIQARQEHNWTQEELAQNANLQTDVIKRIEEGRIKVSLKMLEMVAHAFGMDLSISFQPRE